jgi:hypothetical protein
MTTDQPDSSQSKAAGRGVDLFFGGDETQDVSEAAAESMEAAQAAAGDVVDAAVDGSVQEGADTLQEAAAEAAASAEAVSGQAGEARREPDGPTAPPAPVAVLSAPPPAMPPDRPVVIQQTAPQKPNGCLLAALGALFGGFLGVALTLGFLFLANQGLSYAPRSTVNSLQATVTTYERGAAGLRGDLSTLQGGLSGAQGQVSELQQGLAGLESALEMQGQSQGALAENVTGIAGQVRTLEDEVLPVLQDEVLGLQESVEGVSGAVEVVASDVATLTQRVDTVSVSAERAQRFLAGMQALLATVLSDEMPAATPPLTTTAPLTATPAISPAVPITATPTITATAPLTPEAQVPLTPTLVITATATPTPTLAPDATPTPLGGVIRGVVFLDNDRNGVRDLESEPGIANVRVTLYTQNRTEIARTTTNLQGEFEFTGLNPGIYVVVTTNQPGFASSTPNVLTVILRSNRPAENVNFGNYRP